MQRRQRPIARGAAAMVYALNTRIRARAQQIVRGIAVATVFATVRRPVHRALRIVGHVQGAVVRRTTPQVAKIRLSLLAFVNRTSTAAMSPGVYNVQHSQMHVEVAREIAAVRTWVQVATTKPLNCASVKWMISAAASFGMMFALGLRTKTVVCAVTRDEGSGGYCSASQGYTTSTKVSLQFSAQEIWS